MLFEDTNFTLTLISEDVKSYYTVRQLELENLTVSMGRNKPSSGILSLFLSVPSHWLLRFSKLCFATWFLGIRVMAAL